MSITSPEAQTQGLLPAGSSAPALGHARGSDKLPALCQEPCTGTAEREEAEPKMQSWPDLSAEGWPQAALSPAAVPGCSQAVARP